MISRDRYEIIRAKYGKVASWAVWNAQGERPKSNMGAQGVFDLSRNPALLDLIQPNVVMVGLNFSREVDCMHDFANFHDESPYANDFKIRYAFCGTPYYGAYMTDALKNLVILDAQSVRGYLKKNPEAVCSHMDFFKAELFELGVVKPIILAFGRDVYGILNRNLVPDYYSHLIQITHYSHQISKEGYRDAVLRQIENALKK